MGDQELEQGRDGIEASSYEIVGFPGSCVPKNYVNFILSKWKRTLRHGNEYFKLIDSDHYYALYDKYITTLLARPDALVRLALLTDDRDVALGWSLIEGDILHYVYVQHEQRNQGIGRSLVPTKINTITHITRTGLSAWSNKLPYAKFKP